ncbi:hybrid sensor histidine kinase/response regulator [Zoogloea sp.]|uniref:sensor histidine kinase n=1 Tax=Zoogloea sp. TaxID=49181 RepID=UPI0026177D6E|nr:hybrid sensor histidine kinase/response regulator [Zoogloea sp.]
MVLALVLLLWGGILYKIQEEQSQLVQTINTANLNLARAFEEHTVRTIKSADQAVLFLKFQYERNGAAIDVAGYVREGMIISSIFNQVGVIDENGVYILSNLPNHKEVDLSDREHFRVHKDRDTNQLFVSKPVLGRASGKWSIQMTRRINKPDGRFGGVVVISVDPFYFSEFYSSVDLGEGGVVSLFGRDGIIRARRSGDNLEVGQDVSGGALMRYWEEGLFSGSYLFASKTDGVRRFYSYRALKEYPLAVAVGVREDVALADFWARRTAYLAYAVGMSLVVMVFGGLALHLLNRQYRIAAALRESQLRAEEANRAKSAFLASMSHELRTPLNGIMGYAELLKDSEDEVTREFSGIILSSSEHLLALVNSILDLARMEAGRMELTLRDEAFRPLMDRILKIHLRAAMAKGLRLEWQVADGVPEFWRCDPTRLAQILNNLVGNGLKFTDEGQVRVVADYGADVLEIRVSDTGCGIAPEQQEQVFERFRQADAFLTRRHQGSGLGLALVKELVALMGGSLRLRSAPGQGSEFVLRFPRVPT